MTCPTPAEAEELFERVVYIRNSTQYPFTGDMETSFRAHSRLSAKIGEVIAKKTKYLEWRKAYVMGLLHDCGRIIDEWNEHIFHGIVGYKYMQSLGYDEIAQVCLTHSFYTPDFKDEDYPHYKDYLSESREIMKNFEYNDYDKLIAMVDMLNDRGRICSFEERLADIAKRYRTTPESQEHIKAQLYDLKTFFDEKCQNDIYKILRISA